ncbi:uncharacterized protein METZ01_LOCUS121997, partial [marine metagenome]
VFSEKFGGFIRNQRSLQHFQRVFSIYKFNR